MGEPTCSEYQKKGVLKMRRFLEALFVLFLFSFHISLAQTYVQGNVSGTWTKAGSPYVVTGQVTVPAAQTLVVEPGTVVRFGLGLNMTVNGVLSAKGTGTNSILFTTVEPIPARGQWGGLIFSDTSPLDSSVLEYCTVEYGGSGNTYAISMSSSSVKLRISNSLIRLNYSGVNLRGFNGSLTSSVIEYQQSMGVAGSGRVRGCTISYNSTGYSGGGASIVLCTVIANVLGLSVYGSNTAIDSCLVSGNSSGGLSSPGGLLTGLSIRANVISQNGGDGIKIRNSSFDGVLSGNVVYANGGSGISCGSSTKPYTIENNTIVGNAAGLLGVNTVNAVVRNNIISNNRGIAVQTTASPPPTVKFNNVFANVTDFSGFSVLYGDTSLGFRNSRGTACDPFSNVSINPMFVDTTNADYRLLAQSLMIDAGDTLSPRDPDGSVADIGALYYRTFSIGSRIMAGSSGANFRTFENGDFSAPIFAQWPGVHGTIVDGPIYGTAGTYTGNWWKIMWDSQPPEQNQEPGWSAESVISFAPSAGDVPEPDFTTGSYTTANHFWVQGDAPGTKVPGNLWPENARGNCTWYAYGRMLELGYAAAPLEAIAPPGQGNAYQWAINAKGSLASSMGILLNETPTVGAIAELDSGSFSSLGHVAVVESKHDDGTITVTESSFSNDLGSVWNILWRHRTVSPSWFTNFIHLSKATSVASLTILPSELSLSQNYPNPFNPSTTIEFGLPKSAFVTLRVYDLLGRQVGELINEKLSPGTYTGKWDARDMASGVYFYRLQAGDFVETKKMLLLR
jgi:surface antigen